MKKILLTSTILSAAVATSALADASDWNGFWAGAGVGYGSSNYEISGAYLAEGCDGLCEGSGDFLDLGGEGALYTLEAGYDFHADSNFVFGFQVDYTGSTITNDMNVFISEGTLGRNPDIDFSYDLKPETTWTGAIRAGVLVNDSTLLYGLLGYSETTFVGNASLAIDGGDPESESYDYKSNGTVFGGGIETVVGANSTIKLEYRYTKYDTYDLLDLDLGGSDSLELDLDTSVQSARVVYAYHF